jgi:hypothetical protein
VTGAPYTDPDCDVIDALTYALGGPREKHVRTTSCGGGVPVPTRVRGQPAYASLSTVAPEAGPIGTFRLCPKHASEPPLMEKVLPPMGGSKG